MNTVLYAVNKPVNKRRNVVRVEFEELLGCVDDAELVTALLELHMEGYEVYGETLYEHDSWYALSTNHPRLMTSWRDTWADAVEELLAEVEQLNEK